MTGPLNYRDEGAGPPILFLHGFMGSLSDWDGIVGRLADRYRCVRVDLPGHGQSLHRPDPDLYGLPGSAAAVGRLVEGLDLRSCMVVGYSMGGRVAMHLLPLCPGRLACALLESASPGIEDEAARAVRLQADERLADELSRGPFSEFLDRWYDQPLFESLRERPDMLAAVKAARLDNDPLELARALRGMSVGRQVPRWNALACPLRPILAVAGERDRTYGDLSLRMASLSNRIEAAIVPGTGHTVHLEQPGPFARLVEQWAAKHQ